MKYITTPLPEIIKEIAVPENIYRKAIQRYKSIEEWLQRSESVIARYNPTIYPQGSFRLGTAINSPANKAEYDIDLVCEVNLSKQDITQEQLKKLVGHEIKAYAKRFDIKVAPEEGRRCWTLNYADDENFHVDILPAIPSGKNSNREWAETAIAITDKKHECYEGQCTEWLQSNPEGYAKWFEQRMGSQLENRRREIAKSLNERVENIQSFQVKTPLQQAIQILKAHRDEMFAEDLDNKPISIIITTLAAQVYADEPDLALALTNIVNKITHPIKEENGCYQIENPTNPLENFADKWVEHPERKNAFIRWVKEIQKEHGINFDVSHKERPPWQMKPSGKVRICARAKKGYVPVINFANGSTLDKGVELKFTADTNIEPPYGISWQIVNTGQEAANANNGANLRGKFEESNENNTKEEHTAYTGTHWVECFIIKNGVCVARSGEFIVKIR